MFALSQTEKVVASEYCKGLADKEVADNLNKSLWTVKTQKRTIYRKLGISKDTELVLYMICDRLHRNFDLKEIRKHGLELLFCVLFLIMQITCNNVDMRKTKTPSRARTAMRCARKGEGNKNEYTMV